MKEIKNYKARLILSRFFCYVLLSFIVLMCIFPFYLLFVNATRSTIDIARSFSLLPDKYFFYNFKNLAARTELPILHGLKNSLIVSISVCILTTYFSALTAYGIHIYDFKLKKTAFLFIMLVMMIPTQVSTLGFIKLIRFINLRDNLLPLILPSIASPVVFFFMKQYMESVLLVDIVEAARIDGSNEFSTFNKIILPILKPAIAVQAIFAFVTSWNNYFVPALLIDSNVRKTVPIIIANLRNSDYAKFDLGVIYLMIFISIVPVLITYLILSKFIIRGVTLGSVKG